MTAPRVALTFDNGPTPGVTDAVLDVLTAHRVRATFFAIGHKLATPEGTELACEIVRQGHRLGGHTWSHSVQFGVADDDVVVDELTRTRTAVDAAGGDGLLFRPYGAGGVILHDIVDGALPRLDEFLTELQVQQLPHGEPAWSQEFPDECTPIRGGSPTSSFGTLAQPR